MHSFVFIKKIACVCVQFSQTSVLLTLLLRDVSKGGEQALAGVLIVMLPFCGFQSYTTERESRFAKWMNMLFTG